MDIPINTRIWTWWDKMWDHHNLMLAWWRWCRWHQTDAAPVADNSGGVGARYTIANGITGNAPDAVYYGGGGGGGLGTDGGTPSGSPDGTGGTGGDNDPHTNGTPGKENRGGGGGGGAARGTDAKSDTFRPGGKGGSGVVIIAYPA